MASRRAVFVQGTDGDDYSHRETVVQQYKVSPMTGKDHQESNGLSQEFLEEPTAKQPEEDLPLTGDYHGMGGPNSVPLETTGAFQQPSKVTAYSACLLNDLFMAPTPESLSAFYKVVTKREIAQTKRLLQRGFVAHVLLAIVMFFKLLPVILDKADIFVLEIEELNMPKPLMFEWIWCMSTLPLVLLGTLACKSSNAGHIKKYFALTFFTGILPIVYGMYLHWEDMSTYFSTHNKTSVPHWKGYPVSVLWYIFAILCVNVHFLELYAAKTLIGAWTPRRKSA